MHYIKIYWGHEAKIHENEVSASRGRERGRGQNLWGRGHKIWPRGHIGLEDLTSLYYAIVWNEAWLCMLQSDAESGVDQSWRKTVEQSAESDTGGLRHRDWDNERRGRRWRNLSMYSYQQSRRTNCLCRHTACGPLYVRFCENNVSFSLFYRLCYETPCREL